MQNKSQLILVANPGSASRKYGLYRAGECIANLHFEWVGAKIVCTVETKEDRFETPVGAKDLEHVVEHVDAMLLRSGTLHHGDSIDGIGLRVVAPSGFFLENHKFTQHVHEKLVALERVSPLHIGIVLEEYGLLETVFKGIPIFAISDSAFHASKPDYAWNYAIDLADADTYEIKRYGYHGLSVRSAVRQLTKHDRLASKIVVAHLGSGCSVTALHGGKSLDTTMGYSPLEGLVMATRSGAIDYSAVASLQLQSGKSDAEIEQYLNKQSGLLGLGGSSDIRELVEREKQGDAKAHLALNSFVYGVQKGIAAMTAALGGIDALVFTGTVGERSSIMRRRIVDRMHYLDLILDTKANDVVTDPLGLDIVSRLAGSKPVYVVHADEAGEIARQVADML